MRDLETELRGLQSRARYRRRRVTTTAQGPEMVVDGRPCLTFCSNDYLGLAAEPRVVAAFRAAAERYGVGAGSAHLINGHGAEHQALEAELAEFLGRPRALLFSTGYMANLGVVEALIGRQGLVVEDRLNHASLIDAGRLAGAELRRYPHAHVTAAARALTRPTRSERLLASDGVFSMDGDVAPLAELSRLAQAAGAWLMVDDAHGIGVLGERGRGATELAGLDRHQVPILVGTLGKALGTAGAFVAGSEALIEFLIQRARTYIYTTAAPPAVAAASRESLRIVQQESWRRQKLATLVARFRAGAAELGLPLASSQSPIQPVLLGDTQMASEVSEQLLQRGLLVPAIRPPTVPEGTARLRITLSASHHEGQLDRLLEALAAVLALRPPLAVQRQ